MATTPRIADIGAVPDGLSEDLTRFLQQVQRLLRTGIQTGGISGSGSGASSSGGGTTIIGGGAVGGGIPGMDDPTPPPTPSGVTVDAGLSYVFFETAAPVFTMGAGYDRTRVYIAQYPASATTPPTFGDAVLAYEFVGQIGAMPAEPATRLCVWLKWRSKAGYDSTTPAGGINGFIVETGQDVEQLLKALTGSITSSELHAALGARIDLIDGPDTMAGSVAARLLAEATARGAAITAEQSARQTADTSLANSITALTASVGSNAAAISSEQTARANADAALASQINTVAASVPGAGGNLVKVGSFESGSGGTWSAPVVAISPPGSKPWTKALQITARDTLEAGTVFDVREGEALFVEADVTCWQLPATYRVRLGVKVTTASGSTGFHAGPELIGGSDWTRLAASLVVPAGFVKATPWIQVDDGASGAAAPYPQSWAANISIQRASAATALVQQEATARASVDGHLSTLYTVRTQLTSGGRTVVGGFGLSGTSSPTAGPTIDFGVRADRFWIGPPNDGSAPGVDDIMPFVVQTTPVTINGVVIPKGVYMDAAYIVNLTAMVARLGNAWIDSAMIANLSAAKIIAGSLAVGQYIQSSNYIPGSQGWRINADGSAQFMAANIAGKLTAIQIEADAIESIHLSSRSVTTSKLLVTDLTNLCMNGMGASTDGWESAAAGVVTAAPSGFTYWPTVGVQSDSALNFDGRDAYFGLAFPVKPGDSFYFSIDVVPRLDGPSAYQFGIGFNFKTAAGAPSWVTAASLPSGSSGYSRLTGSITVPAGVATARIWVQIDKPAEHVGGTLGTGFHATGIEVRRKAGTAMIDDLAVTDAKVGNFIKSYNFNGTIDSAGNITNVGTVGWALGRAGVMVVDAAHIRGKLTASQINVTALTAISADLGAVTAGTLENTAGTTKIDLNASGPYQFLLRAGDYDFPSGRYPVQITADGNAMFTKRVASGSWSGSVVYKDFSSGGVNSASFYIDTGYNYPYGQTADREFIARYTGLSTNHSGAASHPPGYYVHSARISLTAVRATTFYKTGAPDNQATNPFLAGNDRMFIRVDIDYVGDVIGLGNIRLTSISWMLFLGT